MRALRNEKILTLSQPAVILALSLAFVLTVGASVLAAMSTRRVSVADQSAKKAQATLAHAAQLLVTINDATAAVRRQILADGAGALALDEAPRQRALRELDALQLAFDGRTQEASVFPRLRERVEAHFSGLYSGLVAARDQEPVAGLSLLENGPVRDLQDEIRRTVAVLQRVELLGLAEGFAAAAKRAELIQALNLGLVTLAVTLAATAAWLLVRRVRDLESLITVCAWTQRVRWQGRWITFEEYLARRFHLRCTHGISEEAAEKLKADSTAPFALETAHPFAGDSAAPFPPGSAAPFPTGSATPFANDSSTPFGSSAGKSPASTMARR